MHWSRRVYVYIIAATTAPLLILPLLGGAPARIVLFALPAAAFGWLAARAVTSPMVEAESIAKRLSKGEWQARPAGRLPEPWHGVVGTMTNLAHDLSRVTRDMEKQVGERTAQLERKAGQLRTLGQVGHQVAAVREPGALLHYVVRLVRGTFGYDLVAVVQDHGDHFISAACAMRGEADPPTGRVFAADDAKVASIVRALRQGDLARDIPTEPIPIIDGWEPRAELIVPIRHGRRTLGAMVVQSASARAFDDDDIFTVDTIAGQVAVALENARLFESERQLRRLAITEERNRIAREIHDTLAQGFMGILIHLRAMQRAEDEDTAARHRTAAESLAQESLQEARRSVWNLRPARLHDKGLSGALEAELERLRSQSGLQTSFAVTGDEETVESLPSDGAAALLRVGQEALHNLIKHARARSVTVALHGREDGIELTISDDGVGFVYPPREQRGRSAFGLIGMRERVEAAGGTLHIDTIPGAGTTVRARIPTADRRPGPGAPLETDAGFAPDAGAATGADAGFTPDAGAATGADAGFTPDAGAATGADAGFTPDAGAAIGADTGFTPDAGAATSADAGFTPDAGAATSADAGFTPDAGAATSADAGFTPDAGAATSADAGFTPDAGAATSADPETDTPTVTGAKIAGDAEPATGDQPAASAEPATDPKPAADARPAADAKPAAGARPAADAQSVADAKPVGGGG